MLDSHILSAVLGDFVDELFRVTEDFCGKDPGFMARYVVNAVLSSIEEIEQESILGMRYHDFVTVSRDAMAENLVSYLDRFSIACRGKSLSNEERVKIREAIRDKKIVNKTLCYLYERGINEDEVPFIEIENVRPGECEEELSKLSDIRVRSRFIETALYLSRLKQRFHDISAFEAKTLVSRVFGFNEKRLLPLGRRSVDEVRDVLGDYSSVLYRKLCDHLKKLYPEKLSGLKCDKAPGTLLEMVREFLDRLKERYGIERFYEFQLRGMEKILGNLIDVVGKDVEKYITLEAPTGSGKSEVFLISSILTALVRRYVCSQASLTCESPAVIITYPRLALARDQFDRLIGYVSALNELLADRGLGKLMVTISLNNMEVVDKNQLWSKIEGKAKPASGCVKELLDMKHFKAALRVCVDEENEIYITYTDEFNLFKCPGNADDKYPRIYLMRNPAVILCGDIPLDFIKVFKDDVKRSPGDIHVTLFESLRLNLWARGWRKLFGDDAGGPLMLVLDEIHTYTNITGARYSYMLRRLMAKIRASRKQGETGFVVVGLSATIPNEDFLYLLFQLDGRYTAKRVDRIAPSEDEVIPVGSDYFYIIIPNFKEPVDPLTVSIQTIMALHFNMPEVSRGSKKTLAFADSLDVVARLSSDLRDAIGTRKLQNLRNPLSPDFENTLRDYGDKLNAPNTARLKEFLPDLTQLLSWSDGELWWPYALECAKDARLCDEKYTKVRTFTSKEREDIGGSGVVTSTSALEVGVDYGDVVVVYQHGAPINIASLIQRAGRGGRRFHLNPLLRNAIAIQISPESPHQAYLLELFMRAKSLRDALKYERLQVAIDNDALKKQTMAEVVIDYYVHKGYPTCVDDIEKFECETLPSFVKNNMREFLDYASRVFNRLARDEIEQLATNVLYEIDDACKGGVGRGI